MKANYKIERVEYINKPLFISVYNWETINLIGLYNWMETKKYDRDSIGQWRIKYKTI